MSTNKKNRNKKNKKQKSPTLPKGLTEYMSHLREVLSIEMIDDIIVDGVVSVQDMVKGTADNAINSVIGKKPLLDTKIIDDILTMPIESREIFLKKINATEESLVNIQEIAFDEERKRNENGERIYGIVECIYITNSLIQYLDDTIHEKKLEQFEIFRKLGVEIASKGMSDALLRKFINFWSYMQENLENIYMQKIGKPSNDLFEQLKDEFIMNVWDEMVIIFYNHFDEIDFSLDVLILNKKIIDREQIFYKTLETLDNVLEGHEELKNKIVSKLKIVNGFDVNGFDSDTTADIEECSRYTYIDSWKELSALASKNGYSLLRSSGDHGIFKNEAGHMVVIPQGRTIGKGLSIKIQKRLELLP